VSWANDFGGDLDAWQAPFLGVMGRSTRSKWAPLHVRKLLGPEGPKSVQPLAARLGRPGHDQLHHFASSPAWDDGPLWRVLAEQADHLLDGEDAVVVIDDTALRKVGKASVGVARQYCGALGKQAKFQCLVSLTLARGEVHVPVGLQIFLPSVWTDDPAPCAEAGVPKAARTYPTSGTSEPSVSRGESNFGYVEGRRTVTEGTTPFATAAHAVFMASTASSVELAATRSASWIGRASTPAARICPRARVIAVASRYIKRWMRTARGLPRWARPSTARDGSARKG
jgi:hypothetical protein